MALATASAIYDNVQGRLINAAVDYVIDQWKLVWEYGTRLEELKEAAETLEKDKAWVEDKAEEEKDRYGRAIYECVNEWLAHVDDIIAEYNKFKEEDDNNGGYPLDFPFENVHKRHHRSKIAEDMRKRAEKVQKEKPQGITHWQGPLSKGFALPIVDFVDLESRGKTMKEITNKLEDSSATMFGIHGLAGVGKTTLVIEAARKVQNRESKLFDLVIMANVGKILDIRKTQGQIADMLGITLQEEGEYARAIRIKERLKKEKNALIILDDVCAKFDLDMLGIPSQSADEKQKSFILKEGKSFAQVAQTQTEPNQTDVPSIEQPKTLSEDAQTKDSSIGSSKPKSEENYKGCKVLLISEVKQVLVQMDVKTNYMILVNTIHDDADAMNLFMNKVRQEDKNSELKHLAAKIVQKCYGLPMSIVTTANALKNQNQLVWQETLNTLERQKLTGTPEYSTKLSYQLLENEELKLTFLLCACMDQDALVSDLVRLCIGLGFLQGIYTVTDARDRVQILLMKLKESGLLSNSYSASRFTMQNLVRDAALLTASEEKQFFILTKGKLDEWPDEGKLKKYTAIFLRRCDVNVEFSGNIKCSRLKVFHFENNGRHFKIPKNFFQEMKELRVLILIGADLSELSSSIKCLRKLRKLCLDKCSNLDDKLCTDIGKLKNLRILSFSGSDIKCLSVALTQLSKLQILDISNCSQLEVIPRDVISNLTSLEELYMSNISTEWGSYDGEKSQTENASLSELADLNLLKNIDLQIPRVELLPKDLFFNNLHSYKIVIGSSNRHLESELNVPEKYELLRYLAIREKASDFDIHSQRGIKMLFERVESLLLEEFTGVQDIFFELNLNGFPFLKQLSIVSNSSIVSLINPKQRSHPEKAFPKLESLYLYKLEKLEKICSCKSLSESSFGKLKVIKVKLCDKLKNVFFASMAKLLVESLETIEVSECNFLQEIVSEEAEDANTSETLEFKMLRSLTLHSLPKFVGFCHTSSAVDKVKFSKLEKIELSLIQIDRLWIGQNPPFAELVHLEVKGCENLKFLLSLSMARNMAKLQSLSITECHNMKLIFSKEQDSIDFKKKERIFPNLKNMKVSNMKRLSKICDFEFPVDSFGKLGTTVIDECHELNHVFTNDMMGIFQHLSSLRVTNCKSIEAMFYAKDKNKLAAGDTTTTLQDVHLETLPKLEHLFYWASEEKNDQPEGNFILKNLQKIWVQDCDRLENIFSVAVVKTTTENLENLVVSDCYGLREIVAEEEDANKPIDKIVFTKLTTIKLLILPEFKSFCGRDSELKFPALSDLSIERCNMLKPYFKRETTDAQRKPIYFFEEALNELKCLQIGSWHAKLLSNYDARMDKLEELHLSGLKDINTLYVFLHSNPNLMSLWLNNSSLEVLVPLERLPSVGRLGVVPKLKSLNLTNLGKLKEIGFERDAILRMIESLTLKSCSRLTALAPSSVFLSHLTNLEVVGCRGLTYLISPSTARALGQLNTMKVMDCESLLEIVSDAGQEKEVDGNKVVIVFEQLTTLELVVLKKLQTFCSFENCSFEFPRLEKFVVNVCPKLENFSQGVSNMPILQKVYVAHQKEMMTWHWRGNLQDTLQYIIKEKKFFGCMDTLRDTDYFEYLNQFWQMNQGLQEDLFKNLKSLMLLGCRFKTYAIPSNVLVSLKILEELEVISCSKITSIFEMDNFKKEQAPFQLKKLTLRSLEDVKHVWQHNKQVIHVFENLQQVTIMSCDKLESVFPVELAKKLTKLERLSVALCKRLVEIVGKEKGAVGTDEGAIERTEDFIVFPELHELQVYDCNKLELFQSHQQQYLEDQSRTSIMRRQPLFTNKVAIPKMKKFYLDPNQALPLSSWLGQSENELLPCLIELQFYNSSYVRSLWITKVMRMKALGFGKNTAFGENSVVGENSDASFLLKIMEKCPKLERFKIYCDKHYWKSIDIPKGLGNRMLYLKEMSLSSLHELESISGLEYLLYLKLLRVSDCPNLTTLGQNCSNLKKLEIDSCGGLKCLFTSSAAKQLKNLEVLKVSHCDSLKEIVGKVQQSDETESASAATNDIEFKCLQWIHLLSLKSLECFYSGNAILKLPSLILVNIETSPEMKKFSPERERRKEPSTPVQVSYDSFNDNFFFHDDLDVAVAFKFLLQPQESLVLSDDDHPVLKVVWPAKMHMPKGYISGSNLKCLVVEGCKSLTDAILPSHLFPFLNNLEKLEVRECNSVKTIFDVQDTSNMIVIPLKTIILENLPALTHVWNKDPKGSLSLPKLEQVTVNECNIIKNLLPASVAIGIIKELNARNCVELVEIVAKDEVATTEETNDEELIMFPMLESLTLVDLPKLTYIYVGKQILSWPQLKKLDICRCKLLKKFAPESIYSAGKVVSPRLEQLSLDKEGVMMIQQELAHLDLQKIRCLTLQGFNNDIDIDNDESDAFPFVFLSKVSLPNIEMLVVADSAFKEIFPSKLPADTSNYAKILSGLQKLELRNLHKLESTGLEICSRLTWLKVECCASLKYLFTSSTFKCLVQLQHLYISNCEALETVLVADQPNGEDEIITLECLKELSLSMLPKLESFYNGKSTLNFTGSAQVSISECKSMKTFSHGDVKVPDSWSVKIDGVSFSEDNPNAIISQQFQKGSNTTDELASQS